jgi:hypothetical protein
LGAARSNPLDGVDRELRCSSSKPAASCAMRCQRGNHAGYFTANKDFETERPDQLHQEPAWQRCAVVGKSTLVGTGPHAFAGIRVGLFVGSVKTRCRPGKAGQKPDPDQPAMGPAHANTDRNVLRDNSSDILRTNDKMLDARLIRRVISPVRRRPSWPSCRSFPRT